MDSATEETNLAVRVDIRSGEGVVKTSFLTLNSVEKSQQLVTGGADDGVVTVTAQGRGRAVLQHYSAAAEVRRAPVSLVVMAGERSVTACCTERGQS